MIETDLTQKMGTLQIYVRNLTTMSTGDLLAYWSPDSRKICDLEDFRITNDIPKNLSCTEICFELSISLFSITLYSEMVIKDTHSGNRYWHYFQKLLITSLDNSIFLNTDDNIICTQLKASIIPYNRTSGT